jgi:hypothetical protein
MSNYDAEWMRMLERAIMLLLVLLLAVVTALAWCVSYG